MLLQREGVVLETRLGELLLDLLLEIFELFFDLGVDIPITDVFQRTTRECNNITSWCSQFLIGRVAAVNHTLRNRIQVTNRLIIRMKVVMIVVRHSAHCGNLLAMRLMILMCVLVQRPWNVLPNVRHLDHLFVLTLLDARHRRHDSSCDSLTTSFSHGHIDAVGESVLHVPVVHLLHV